ncbi:MAG: lipoyl(octanoyl) transferase LipB [Phycisphaerales bacterium]|nr:lipoyl(octanoyl) transferase LipB [Phycisphaerales bacterium]
MRIIDLGTLAYREAWREQQRLHEQVVAGAEEAIVLLEHPPVITMGRRGETLGVRNLRVSAEALQSRGVEFVQTDRGGDITFHGPGQLVTYPIIRLTDHNLSVGGYVGALQEAVIRTLREFGIQSSTDRAGVGVWVHPSTATEPANAPEAAGEARKIAAIGVRVKRGVTMHGLALNVTTDLSYFQLIVPCGIADRGVTSLKQLLGEQCPTMERVKSVLVGKLQEAIGW